MRGKSIAEVVLAFLAMKLFAIWFDAWLFWQGVPAPLRTLLFGLQAIIIPLLIIGLTGRKLSESGIRIPDRKGMIRLAFIGTMLMMLLGIAMGFLKSRHISSSGMRGSLILSAVAAVMIIAFALITRKDGAAPYRTSLFRKPGFQIAIMALMAATPVIVALSRGIGISGIAAWDLYFLILVGFGEEFKYRGYMQSLINREFKRPWRFMGVPYGPGLLIVALLFGLSHIAQAGIFNPFLGKMTVNPWMALQATCGGLFFGLIREKAESIVASGLAHGVPNAFGQVLAMALK